MIATSVINMVTNAIFLSFSALTPLQRWQAAGRFNTNFMTERWFIVTGVIAIIILTILLVAVSFNRIMQERKVTEQFFVTYARKRGLNEHECQVLLDIATRAGLKHSEAIFTMDGAFDRGAAKMIEENLGRHQTDEENKRLRYELSLLREKLGFRKQPLSSIGSLSKSSKKLSSRQIPVGKKLHITRRMPPDSKDIESTVIKNNDMELTVKLAVPVESTAGELWYARYQFGASVWEFDTSVVSCSGDILVLNHGDNVRFINRRRFLRVPVRKPALIARFPFAKTLGPINDDCKDTSPVCWELPEFTSAVVTELAGPGLRIEAPLKVKVGERVLVIFKLDEGKDTEESIAQQSAKKQTIKMVEDIGEVRHIKTIQNGLSIAVELTGLNDSDVNELIRATNVASLKANAEGPAETDISKPEPVVVEEG
jgi:hypothetical protein